MIGLSPHLDLGLDSNRIRRDDANRQEFTAQALLERFFPKKSSTPYAVQMLADEVGMGKTFVAFAVAYSVLARLRSGGHTDLSNACQKIVILTPQNEMLYKKWKSEVDEFLQRCVTDRHRAEARKWFQAEECEHFDDLVRAIRKPGPGPSLLLCKYRTLSGQLQDHKSKQIVLLAALFRWWRKQMPIESRKRILNGAAQVWGEKLNPDELDWKLDHPEYGFWSYEGFQRAFEDATLSGDLRAIFEDLKEVGETWSIDEREGKYGRLMKNLYRLYRGVSSVLISSTIPLVIVDEAHNWRRGSNGFSQFCDLLAPHTKRLLLLTATPFQLQPFEMLRVLEAYKYLRVESDVKQAYANIHKKLGDEDADSGLLLNSIQAGNRFVRAWQSLPADTTPDEIIKAWDDKSETGSSNPLNDLVRQGRALSEANAQVSSELGKVIIRHRRDTRHRAYFVGLEVIKPARAIARPDRHILHGERGLGYGDPSVMVELGQYTLMKAIDAIDPARRTVLGSSLTGCFSYLFESAEGKRLQSRSPEASFYIDLLHDIVGKGKEAETDKKHPKLAVVANRCTEAWTNGEKVVVFCFHPHNAKRLKDIVQELISSKLRKLRSQMFGGSSEMAFKQFSSRLSNRRDSLAAISFDRVLLTYSILSNLPLPDQKDLPYDTIAKLILRADPDFEKEKPDRLLVLRAYECASAQLLTPKAQGEYLRLIRRMESEDWVRRPYGTRRSSLRLGGFAGSDELKEIGSGVETARSRGLAYSYDLHGDPEPRKLESVIKWLKQSDVAKQITAGSGPNLWGPFFSGSPNAQISNELISKLWKLTRLEGQGGFDWAARFNVIQLMRRAFLRPSFLLRAIGQYEERSLTAGALVNRFYEPLVTREESLAQRLDLFLGELIETANRESREQMLLSALTFLEPVAIVQGNTSSHDRLNRFMGFNSPLLPEILICTSVGQEGINLHRFCRQVIHYDLPFNPATLEQRTGRIDRIGCKALRDRTARGDDVFLEVVVPYLAGTYDERIYEAMRTRAQTFEVLTGGDLTRDLPIDQDITDSQGKDSKSPELSLIQIPEQMVKDLRVRMSVAQG